jgi:hypothetical protein
MQVLTTALGRPRDGQGVRGRAGAMAGAWSSSTRDGAARDTYLSQSGPALCRLVACTRDRACQMRDGGVIASPQVAPATRPLARVYQLLRPKSRADEGDVVVVRGSDPPSRTAKPFMTVRRTTKRRRRRKPSHRRTHEAHLAHTQYQISHLELPKREARRRDPPWRRVC